MLGISILTNEEMKFITTIATNFMDSYRVKDKIVIDEFEEQDEKLTEEIDICKNLIRKLGCGEGKEYLHLEIRKDGDIWNKLFRNEGIYNEKH